MKVGLEIIGWQPMPRGAMSEIETILGTMRRVWMLERCARGMLFTVAVALEAVVLCLLLNGLAGVPLVSIGLVAGLAMVGMIGVVIRVARSVPSAAMLARLLDERAGTRDLFASAMEFRAASERFGWLGELTCGLAQSRATTVALRPRWSLGSRRQWGAIGASAAVLVGAYVAVMMVGSGGKAPVANQVAIVTPAKIDGPPIKPAVEQTRPVEAAPMAIQPDAASPETQPTTEPAVKITNEMIDKYLAQMPASQEVDLTGVTPIRWDADESSGKNNPQNQPPPEKIDPVKLDASLLKDLQDAKKKEDKEGGKQGGVDIAVMGDQGETKAKGKEGGKNSGESLANAVSKDPRGEPTRMAIKPAKKGLQIRSFERTGSKQKGEERPMGLLDFLTALERLKTEPADNPQSQAIAGEKPADRVVRHEAVSDDAAALSEAYFGRLRKADR